MMDFALSILALIAGGVTIELFGAAKAPLTPADDFRLPIGMEAPPSAKDARRGNAR